MVVAKRTLSVGIPRLVHRLLFHWLYWTHHTPWDTNVPPPELVQLIEQEQFPPGRALDLGCGTGTNAIYLAQHGFEVIGVDFVARAIALARQKAQAAGVSVEFRVADVLAPGSLGKPFDLILDIGCFHNLDPYGHVRYADNTRKWTHQGSLLMIYAFFPFKMGLRRGGVSRAEMEELFSRDYYLRSYADDGKSAWYRWERK